jgi:hypothetical protein
VSFAWAVSSTLPPDECPLLRKRSSSLLRRLSFDFSTGTFFWPILSASSSSLELEGGSPSHTSISTQRQPRRRTFL